MALGCDADYHETLVRSRVNVDELALLRLEVCLSRALRILRRLIQLIGNGHVHLDFDTGQVDVVVFVSHHEILVAIVPEKRVSLHLNQLIRRCRSIALSIVLETL